MEDKKTMVKENTIDNGKKVRKKKVRLKKSVRRTIGALLLVTALIVAAIPVGNASATTEKNTLPGDPNEYVSLVPDNVKDILNAIPSGKRVSYSKKFPVESMGGVISSGTDSGKILAYGGFPLILEENEEGDLAPAYEQIGTKKTSYFKIDASGFDDRTMVDSTFVLGNDGPSGHGYFGLFRGDVSTYLPANGVMHMGDYVGYSSGKASTKPWYNSDKSIKYMEEEDPYEISINYEDDGNPNPVIYKCSRIKVNEYAIDVEATLAAGDDAEPVYDSIPYRSYYVCKAYNTLNYICDEAFTYPDITAPNTGNVTGVIMPSHIMGIGNKAFYNCNSLNSIEFGSGLKNIGSEAFGNCTALGTVNYDVNMGGLTKVGDAAFANTNLHDLCPTGESGFIIPRTTDAVYGTAVFYNIALTQILKWDTTNLTIGDYLFARCRNLEYVDLENHTGGVIDNNPNITNLGKVGTTEGAKFTFADCNIRECHLPTAFVGTLTRHTFDNCPMQLLEVRNNRSDVEFVNTADDNEFDIAKIAYGFEILGPEPSSIDPDNTDVKAYKYAIKELTSYPYKFKKAADNMYYYLLQSEDPDDSTKHTGYVLEIRSGNGSSRDGYITDSFPMTNPAAVSDLELGAKAGKLSLSGIDEKAFYENKTIVNLTLRSNFKEIGVSAFEHLSRLNTVHVETNGTIFDNDCFYNNSGLKEVSLDYAGTGNSSIGSRAFGKCLSLTNVNFANDDHETGLVINDEITSYARVSSIADDAFCDTDDSIRNTEIVFKGPMFKGYAPYEFAIAPGDISKNHIYVKYMTGNPYNLVAQYQNASSGTNPDGEPVTYDSGVYLLEYPNMTTYINDDIHKIEDIKGFAIPSKMDTAILKQTQNIRVPYGIDYIDKAKSDITTSAKYTKFDKNQNLYTKTNVCGEYYMFAYVPELKTVVFEQDSVHVFPDYMFECTPDLETVVFNTDVTDIGKLPFYWPDSEDIETVERDTFEKTFIHGDLSPSKISSVAFNGEATAPVFSCNNGIIKSTDTGSIIVEEILPSRGNTSLAGGIGSNAIAADELSGVTGFRDYAARDCDNIKKVDLTKTNKADIAEGTFFDCDLIEEVIFPDASIDVYAEAFGAISNPFQAYFEANPGQYYLDKKAFNPAMSSKPDRYPSVTFRVHEGADALISYANDHANITVGDFLKESFLVYFVDYDGSELQDPVTLQTGDFPYNYKPEDPKRQGYTFTGWKTSKGVDVTNLTQLYETTTIIAQYEIGNLWMVKFLDYNGNVIKNERVKDGQFATAPTVVPEIEGKKFIRWVPDPEQYAIYQDESFVAEYDDVGVEHYVTFYLYEEGKKNNKVFAGPYKLKDGQSIESAKITIADPPAPAGYKFSGWSPSLNTPVTERNVDADNNLNVYPIFAKDSTSSSGSSSSSSSQSSSSKSSSSKSSSSKSSSSSGKSSSSGSTAYPYFVTSQDAGGNPVSYASNNSPIGSTVYINENGNYDNPQEGGSLNNGNGNVLIESNRDGISDPDKMSATVNGSSDNYVVRITRTQEADDMALIALRAEYGDDVSAIRYLPYDISVYDATGTNKISPLPPGMTINITMPIPDDLAIYGGNTKVASTVGGVLENITPKFTMINGVPCMNYTITHTSPYVAYVDTNNLTAAGISDTTPKTADPIHPKWFLCIGLAAIALVLLIKRDPEEYLKKISA